jgi:hypothetical protein
MCDARSAARAWGLTLALIVGVLWLPQGTLAAAARSSSVNIWGMRQPAAAKVPYFDDIL